MNKTAAILLTTSLALGGYGVANASADHQGKHEYQGKHCKHGKYGKKDGEARLERMKAKLGLSEKQVTQIRAIKDKHRPGKMALRGKMKETRMQLRAAMHADQIDKAKVKQLAQQMGSLKVEKIMLKADMRSEVNKVLTAEQRAKKKEIHKGRHDRHREHRGHH